jgi:hypothetical protein
MIIKFLLTKIIIFMKVLTLKYTVKNWMTQETLKFR